MEVLAQFHLSKVFDNGQAYESGFWVCFSGA